MGVLLLVLAPHSLGYFSSKVFHTTFEPYPDPTRPFPAKCDFLLYDDGTKIFYRDTTDFWSDLAITAFAAHIDRRWNCDGVGSPTSSGSVRIHSHVSGNAGKSILSGAHDEQRPADYLCDGSDLRGLYRDPAMEDVSNTETRGGMTRAKNAPDAGKTSGAQGG